MRMRIGGFQVYIMILYFFLCVIWFGFVAIDEMVKDDFMFENRKEREFFN